MGRSSMERERTDRPVASGRNGRPVRPARGSDAKGAASGGARAGVARAGGARPGRSPVRPGRRRPTRGQLVLRWLVLLVVASLVVVGIVAGVKALISAVSEAISSAAAAAASPTPTTTGPPSPVDCTPADIEISLTADSASYRVGRTATFEIGITHTGTLPCTLDAGNVGRELLITSGEDRIYSSADCDTAGSTLLLLAPGDQYPGSVAWGTNRSAPGCPSGLPVLGAGSYQAVVTAGTVSSPPIAFTVG